MALTTTNISAANTSTYTSVGESAIVFMSLCNYGGADVLVDIHAVPDGDAINDTNLLIKDLEILAGDTYILYHGGEKLIISNNDRIVVSSSILNSVTAITSTAAV